MDTTGLPARLQARLARGRAMHRARMLDTFDIGTVETQYVDGHDVQVVTPLPGLSGVPGYFAAARRSVSSTQAGDRTVLAEVHELRVPWDSPEVPADAVAVCTAISPMTPPRQLGRTVRVSASSGDGSQRTHYPLEVVEVLT